MRIRKKLSLSMFGVGCFLLALASAASYLLMRENALTVQREFMTQLAVSVARDIDQTFHEKSKAAIILSKAPVLLSSLEAANRRLSQLSEHARTQEIKALNTQWMSSKDATSPFIRQYLENPSAIFLKQVQKSLPGEFGEIFVSNRYGALTASTAKLTTLAHGHKYWWKGCYSKGKGRVFLDDRGFDHSVGGVVLGLVVPVRNDRQIVGILKVNLNILGSISQTLAGHDHHGRSLLSADTMKLVRAGGRVIYEEGRKPLSTVVSDALRKRMTVVKPGSVVIDLSGKSFLVGFAPIPATVSGEGEHFLFGGAQKSADHKTGGGGQAWFVATYLSMEKVLAPAARSVQDVLISGLFLVVILAGVAFWFGKRTSRPVLELARGAEKVGKGDFHVRLAIDANDELGELGKAFNNMASELEQTTTTLSSLEQEISRREMVEHERENLIAELRLALQEVKQLGGLLPICSNCKKIRDDQGYWQQVESYIGAHSDADFTHSICPDCLRTLYPDMADAVLDRIDPKRPSD